MTRVKEKRGACDECQTALAALKKNLADQEANSVVGKYYSIDKHDWEKGLPYLIQGTPDSLQANATREQTLRQKKVPAADIIDQMFDLAGDWWTLFEVEDTEGKDKKLATGIKTHASDLYAELLPNLTPVKKVLAARRAKGGFPVPPKPKRIDNSIGMEFVEIPTKSFWLGKFEVTQSQFKNVMGVEPWRGGGQRSRWRRRRSIVCGLGRGHLIL